MSLTACGSNVLEFEAVKVTVQIRETSEELIGSNEGVEGMLKINQNQNKIEYNNGTKTFYGKMEEFDELISAGSGTGYYIEWDETPEVLADFDVFDSAIAIFPENEISDSIAILMFGVERTGYYDLLVSYTCEIR